MTFLIEGQLFAQKEFFCYQHRSWTQTEVKETDSSAQQRQQRASERQHMMEQVRILCHCQNVPLQQGCLLLILTIIRAAKVGVQSYEDRVIAEHSFLDSTFRGSTLKVSVSLAQTLHLGKIVNQLRQEPNDPHIDRYDDRYKHCRCCNLLGSASRLLRENNMGTCELRSM